MKLIFVTSLKEYQKEVAHLFREAKIAVFSISETTGFKDHFKENLMDNWFSSGGDQFDSIFLFSFTDADRANNLMELIRGYNGKNETGFPIRAFIVPVEQSSHTPN